MAGLDSVTSSETLHKYPPLQISIWYDIKDRAACYTTNTTKHEKRRREAVELDPASGGKGRKTEEKDAKRVKLKEQHDWCPRGREEANQRRGKKTVFWRELLAVPTDSDSS